MVYVLSELVLAIKKFLRNPCSLFSTFVAKIYFSRINNGLDNWLCDTMVVEKPDAQKRHSTLYWTSYFIGSLFLLRNWRNHVQRFCITCWIAPVQAKNIIIVFYCIFFSNKILISVLKTDILQNAQKF